MGKPGAAPANVSIRPATLDDLPALTAIYNHYIEHTAVTFDTEPFTVDQRRAWFDRYAAHGRYRLLVCAVDGVVAGYTSASRYHERRAYDTTVESTIVCAPEFVGRRLGDHLYGALFTALAGEPVHAVVAAITVPNEASCAIHERFGYRRVGVIEEAGWKFGRYWDVALYQRLQP
jgi:phosphinothricin acetyltransferase